MPKVSLKNIFTRYDKTGFTYFYRIVKYGTITMAKGYYSKRENLYKEPKYDSKKDIYIIGEIKIKYADNGKYYASEEHRFSIPFKEDGVQKYYIRIHADYPGHDKHPKHDVVVQDPRF